MIEHIALILSILAGTLSFGFIALYSTFMWDKTPEGRNTMIFSATVLVLSTVAIVNRGFPNLWVDDVVASVAWAGVAILMAHRISLLLRRKGD